MFFKYRFSDCVLRDSDLLALRGRWGDRGRENFKKMKKAPPQMSHTQQERLQYQMSIFDNMIWLICICLCVILSSRN